MNDTFMKEKPILPLLTSMALPMVISMLVNSLYNIVDSFFVAQINEQAMTALSLVFPVQNFVNATAIGFGVGINAMIAFHLGAGNKENANASATHGMILSVVHGFLALIISIAIPMPWERYSMVRMPHRLPWYALPCSISCRIPTTLVSIASAVTTTI